jgi:hypothetical protein
MMSCSDAVKATAAACYEVVSGASPPGKPQAPVKIYAVAMKAILCSTLRRQERHVAIVAFPSSCHDESLKTAPPCHDTNRKLQKTRRAQAIRRSLSSEENACSLLLTSGPISMGM